MDEDYGLSERISRYEDRERRGDSAIRKDPSRSRSNVGSDREYDSVRHGGQSVAAAGKKDNDKLAFMSGTRSVSSTSSTMSKAHLNRGQRGFSENPNSNATFPRFGSTLLSESRSPSPQVPGSENDPNYFDRKGKTKASDRLRTVLDQGASTDKGKGKAKEGPKGEARK